jgi:hypothetical protein
VTAPQTASNEIAQKLACVFSRAWAMQLYDFDARDTNLGSCIEQHWHRCVCYPAVRAPRKQHEPTSLKNSQLFVPVCTALAGGGGRCRRQSW